MRIIGPLAIGVFLTAIGMPSPLVFAAMIALWLAAELTAPKSWLR